MSLRWTWYVCVKTVSDCCRAFIDLSIRAKNDCWGTSPSMWKFGEYWPTPLDNADFQSRIGSSPLAYAFSNKPKTNITLTLIPQRGSKTQSVQIQTTICDNFKTVQDIYRMTVVIHYRKWHTVFRLVPTSVTSNGVTAFTLLYFTEFDSFAGHVTVIEDWHILSAEYCLPLLAKIDQPRRQK